jgi:hypothetical protein
MLGRNLKFYDFKHWLFRQRPEDIVGYVGDCTRCPVANFINHVTKDGSCMIGCNVYLLEDSTVIEQLPKWARQFIDRIELLPKATPVTSMYALRVLNVPTRYIYFEVVSRHRLISPWRLRDVRSHV